MGTERGHRIAVVIAILTGAALLAGMLFGHAPLPDALAIPDRTVRQTCIALWTFLLPLWFTIEERWVPSNPDDPNDPALIRAIAAFRSTQQFARALWTGLGGAVAIVIGLTPNPDGTIAKKQETTQVQAAQPAAKVDGKVSP